MRELLRRVGHLAVHVSAASLWALGGAIIVLSVAGVIPSSHWIAAVGVLHGTRTAVDSARFIELQKLAQKQRELQQRHAVEPTYSYLRQALTSMEEDNRRREVAINDERVRLAAWQDELTGLQDAIRSDIDLLQQRKTEVEAEIQRATTTVLSEADRRVFNIYRQMEASQVATDLQSRFASGDTAGAAEILNRLPERQAAEALAEIDDPQVRVGLLQEMRTAAAKRLAGLAPATSLGGTEGTGE